MTSAEPFDLVGDGTGVVCVHGFTGTPYELRYLGEQVASAGFAAVGPLLPGHGTTLDDLDRTTWHDWVNAVDASIDRTRERYGRIALVGQSLGGLLALHAASRRDDITCVAALATPLWLDGLGGRVARWTTQGPLSFVRRLPKLGGSDVRDRRVRAENPCYPAIPTRALGQLLAFMRIVDEALPRVRCPVLVVHARHDHTAPVACATRIAEATHAERLRILPRSYHLIAADVERDVVAREVIALLQRHSTTEGSLPCAM
ncbi:MAG TPA: alpha/beta fold hydrolase [Kofleriaceae bacterium]|nr:alpha/beta fold hydrolase [Kofleriaceae bacterium]